MIKKVICNHVICPNIQFILITWLDQGIPGEA